MAKDKSKSKSENSSDANTKELLENVLSRMNTPSTSKVQDSSSEEESSEEDMKTKNAQMQPVRNNKFQFNNNRQLLQAASLTVPKDYSRQITVDSTISPVKNRAKAISPSKGILKKLKKSETISDSESDRDSGKSVFAATDTLSHSKNYFEDNVSDEDFNENLLATSTQNETTKNEVCKKKVVKHSTSRPKNKKIKIIENIAITPASKFFEQNDEREEEEDKKEDEKEETVDDDDEIEDDVVLSSLKCLYPEEHFTKLSRKCTLKDNIDDADVFLVHVPKSLDPKLLVGCTISTKKNTKLKVNGEKIIIQTSCGDTKPLSTIVKLKNGRYGCKMLRSVGNMLVHHELESSGKAEPLSVVNNSIEFPEELKMRHPLFGADYSHKISIDDETQQKLNEAITGHLKKKKKKKSKEIKQDNNEDDEMVFKLLDGSTSGKHKNVLDSNNENFMEEEEEEKKKRKKKKKEKESSFEVKTPIKVMHSTMLGTLESTPIFNPPNDKELTVIEHTKKKKKHKKEDHQDLIMKLLEQYTSNTEVEAKSNRKHKHDDDAAKGEKKKKKKCHY